jgi:hypothetical protein
MATKHILHLPFWLFPVLLPLGGAWADLAAQSGCASVTRARSSVTADLATQQWTGSFPFDEVFTLRLAIPELEPVSPRMNEIRLAYGPAREESHTASDGTVTRDLVMAEPIDRDVVPLTGPVKVKEVFFTVGPLDPSRVYLFDFQLFSDTTRRASVRMAAASRPDVTSHFDLDAGVLRSNRLQYTGMVIDAHYYLVPVNNNECPDNYRGAEEILKRVSLFAGISVLRLSSKDNVHNFFERGAPAIGIGLNRLPYLGPVRINGGLLFVKQDHANPLVSERVTKADPFVSVTVDFELRRVLGPLAGLFGLGG